MHIIKETCLMECNTFYEDQCCTSCFKGEGTNITECPSYHIAHPERLAVNENYLFLFRAAIYANRHYLSIYHDTHPERLAINEKDQPTITGDVYIHPTAEVHLSALVS